MKLFKLLARYIDDVLLFSWCVTILIGTYKLSPIAAWFVAGAELLIAGVLVAWSKKPNDPS